MEDDIEGLQQMMNNLDKLKFSRKEKSKIVEAGAKIVESDLKKSTIQAKTHPATGEIIMDFKKSKGGYYKYAAKLEDGITHKPNQYIDGSTDIGFQKGFVTVAHWFNDGTYRQPGTYFMNKSFHDSIETGEVQKAQILKATSILNKKEIL